MVIIRKYKSRYYIYRLTRLRLSRRQATCKFMCSVTTVWPFFCDIDPMTLILDLDLKIYLLLKIKFRSRHSKVRDGKGQTDTHATERITMHICRW